MDVLFLCLLLLRAGEGEGGGGGDGGGGERVGGRKVRGALHLMLQLLWFLHFDGLEQK